MPRLALFLMLSFAIAPSLLSAETKVRWGFDAKAFQIGASGRKLMSSFNANDNLGDMLGFRTGIYPGNSDFSLGVEGYAGASKTAQISSRNYVYYGGLTLGFDKKIGSAFYYELGLLAGYGEASLGERASGKSSVLEPTIAIGFILGGGWRLGFRGGYIHAPSANGVSGFNFGLRLERKSLTTSRSAD